MLSLRTIMLQVAILVAVAMAQRAGHRMPMPSITNVAFVPEAPILPSEFTSAISEYTHPDDGAVDLIGKGYQSSNLSSALAQVPPCLLLVL